MRQRHQPIFTSYNILQDKSRLNNLGFQVIANRLAARRGKSKRWTKKYAKEIKRAQVQHEQELERKWRELLEKMQEDENGESGDTGEHES